jgi:LysM repeat protein
MKKEVQALIKRRRARMFPAILAGIALLIILGFVVLVVAVIPGARSLGIGVTDTPTVTLTLTPSPTATTPPDTDTPAPTPTITETAGPSPTPTQHIYTVAEGDSLFTIAEQFGSNVCLMMALNNIVDASALSVGQTLIIPSGTEELPTATPLPTGLPRGARLEYIVQCGDTLDSIAAQFNSTGDDIATENDIDDPLSIQIGDVLIVRANIATPTPTSTFTATPEGGAAATETPTAPVTTTPTP